MSRNGQPQQSFWASTKNLFICILFVIKCIYRGFTLQTVIPKIFYWGSRRNRHPRNPQKCHPRNPLSGIQTNFSKLYWFPFSWEWHNNTGFPLPREWQRDRGNDEKSTGMTSQVFLSVSEEFPYLMKVALLIGKVWVLLKNSEVYNLWVE